MGQQDTENLFRRYKGQMARLNTISGGKHEGRIGETSNDYVALIEPGTETSTLVFFNAIESIVIEESSKQ